MLVRLDLQQQAQTAQPTPRTAERPERPERPEAPERPERASTPSATELRQQIGQAFRAAQEAAQDARAAQELENQVRIQNGQPVIAGGQGATTIQVHPRSAADMIPPQVVDIALGFFIMCAVMVVGWPLARALGRRLERSGQPAAITPALTEQLTRIEQAVDAMSVEVERISEAQRYLTKLQSGSVAESAALQAGNRR
jgi:hypothetical protein